MAVRAADDCPRAFSDGGRPGHHLRSPAFDAGNARRTALARRDTGGERHAVGAALAATAAALDGWTIIYLGVDVPAADIVAGAATSRADAVALSIVHSSNPAAVVREVHAVRASMPATIPVLTGGALAVKMTKSLEQPGIVVCDSIAGMRRVLARAAQAS